MAFPSPAKDYAEAELSLDQLCIKRRSSTFFMRAEGSYIRFGISADSILVIDRARRPVDGSLVVAEIEGRFQVCMLHINPYPMLKSLNDLAVIKSFGADFWSEETTVIFGVVTYAVNDMTSFEFHDNLPF